MAIDYFDKAIELAKTEMEMTHLFSLRDAAISQQKISTKLGISSQLLKLSVWFENTATHNLLLF